MALNQNMGYGSALLSSLPFTCGKVFVVADAGFQGVQNSRGLEQVLPYDDDGEHHYFSNLNDAVNATVPGRNDVIILTNDSSHVLTASQYSSVPTAMTIATNRVHLMSVDYVLGVRERSDQRTKITLTDISGSSTALLTITSSGFTAQGIKFINSSTTATSLGVVSDQSTDGVVFDCCTFEHNGSAYLTSASGYIIDCSNDTSEYTNCTISDNTAQETSAGTSVLFSQAGSTAEQRVQFKNCLFEKWAGTAGATFVKKSASTSISRYALFEECTFLNFGTQITYGVVGTSSGQPMVFIRSPMSNVGTYFSGTDILRDSSTLSGIVANS